VEDIDDAIDDEIDDIDVDDVIEDIDIEEDDDIDETSKEVPAPAPQKPLNRLILKRNQDWESRNPNDAFDAEGPSGNESPHRIIPSTQQDMAGPDLNDDFDEDDDEVVVGAWLRPMPRRKWRGGGEDLGFGWGPRISDLPSGISRGPFRWDYLKQSFAMEFLGGFVGVSQDKEALAVKPEIGWAVRDAPANG
jgi:hypothetical protein